MTKKIHCMFRKQRLPAQANVHCKHEGLWTSTRTPTNIFTSFCSRPPKSTWFANINYAHAHAVYTRLFFLRPQRAWVRGYPGTGLHGTVTTFNLAVVMKLCYQETFKSKRLATLKYKCSIVFVYKHLNYTQSNVHMHDKDTIDSHTSISL